MTPQERREAATFMQAALGRHITTNECALILDRLDYLVQMGEFPSVTMMRLNPPARYRAPGSEQDEPGLSRATAAMLRG